MIAAVEAIPAVQNRRHSAQTGILGKLQGWGIELPHHTCRSNELLPASLPRPGDNGRIGKTEPVKTKAVCPRFRKPCLLGRDWNLHTFNCGSTVQDHGPGTGNPRIYLNRGSSPGTRSYL
ncbi:hypothetical protein GCM10023346_20690 [Arthrobacter gyeryongensis]|uniref:Uncharacterized protein n=1 Tax=Arthrobacter gyeryongensis TaxID=1650592 RepID=A0ABP9SF75_9MICC